MNVVTGDCEFDTVAVLLSVFTAVGDWDSETEDEPELDTVGELLADMKDDAVGESVLDTVADEVIDLMAVSVSIEEIDEMGVDDEDSDEVVVTVTE